MGTVKIDSNDYDIIGDEDGAMTHLMGSITGAGWKGICSEDQRRALVSSTRSLVQHLANCGLTIDPSVDQPDLLQQTAYELALDLGQGKTSVLTKGVGADSSNIRRAKAGSAEVEFFRPVDGTRFGSRVQQFLNAYLASVKGVADGGAGGGALVIAVGSCDDPFRDEKSPDLFNGFA